MIDEKELRRRIIDTKYDVFPLNKILPLSTVYSYFKHEYDNKNDKTIFTNDRKYQRLREGYFSLCAALALKKRGRNEYFMRFPIKTDNDVDIISIKDIESIRPEFWRLVCDVKEFTDYSESFEEFIKKTIKKRIISKEYHLIIGLHRNINEEELRLLEKIAKKESTIWVVSASSGKFIDYKKSIVTTIQGVNCIVQDEINLNELALKQEEIPIIFQDTICEKL